MTLIKEKHIVYTVFTFFLLSFAGWLWEGFYVGLSYGGFVNRGFLHGPWVPIYGVGGVLIMLLLNHFDKEPGKVFLYSVGISGVLEYATSFLQEMLFHQTWWDYSDRFMNLNGRVCLANLVAFGAAGTIAVCILKPIMEQKYSSIRKQTLQRLCMGIAIVFLMDISVSILSPHMGLGITY